MRAKLFIISVPKTALEILLYQMRIYNAGNVRNEALRRKVISSLLCYCIIFNVAQKFLEKTAKYNFRDNDELLPTSRPEFSL